MNCSCRKGCTSANLLLKFAALVPATATAATTYLTDAAAVPVVQLNYPLPARLTALRLSVNVRSSGLSEDITLRVRLLRNGVAVPGFELNFGGANPFTGILTVTPAAQVFSVGQTLDLEVTTVGTLDSIIVSAMLAARLAA